MVFIGVLETFAFEQQYVSASIEIGGLLMKLNFQTMTIGELKKYVLEHRDDKAAFQALMKRIDAQPQEQVYGEVNPEQFSEILKQHRGFQTD
jgi:uncharacterized coiled-coil protein SlyX